MTGIADLLARRPQLAMAAEAGLLLDGVALNAIADALGTPAWVISADTIRARVAALRAALAGGGVDATIHYAVKANDHLAVLSLMARAGVGADIVSEGELLRTQAAGIAAAHVVFSGVGKSDDAIRAALRAGVASINVESAEEIDRLGFLARETGCAAPVLLRVNPDVDAGTHDKIATGRAGDKFGVAHGDACAAYARTARTEGLRAEGFAVHIGSNIFSAAPFRAAFDVLARLTRTVREAGFAVRRIDAGGGLGVGYRDEPDADPGVFAAVLRDTLGPLDVALGIEPGRWLVAGAGVLLASVIQPKEAGGERFLIVDAAMNDLIRPALYGAFHGIVPLSAVEALRPAVPVTVAGPVCESGDVFARDRPLPLLAAGARVAFLDAGAYGSVMSSTYNARPLAPIAMIDHGRWSVIRPRQQHAALWAEERVPPSGLPHSQQHESGSA